VHEGVPWSAKAARCLKTQNIKYIFKNIYLNYLYLLTHYKIEKIKKCLDPIIKKPLVAMNTFRKLAYLTGLAAFSVVLLGAEAADQKNKDEKKDEVFLLSPFQVSGESATSGFGSANASGGTRIATELVKAPMSLVVLNEEFRQTIGALDLQELTRFTSGVQAETRHGNGGITLRGHGLSGESFRDGIPRFVASERPYDFADMAFYERVELIKGPAGTLYGSHNSGGVINYVSKVPMNKPATSLGFNYRPQRDLYRVELDDTRPFGEGWAYRVIGAYQRGKSLAELRDDTDAFAFAIAKKFRRVGLLARYSYENRDLLNNGGYFLDGADNLSTFLPANKSLIDDKDSFIQRDYYSIDLEATLGLDFANVSMSNRLLFRFSDNSSDSLLYVGTGAGTLLFYDANNILLGNGNTGRLNDPRLAYITRGRQVNAVETKGKAWSINYDNVLEFDTGPLSHKLLGYVTGQAHDSSRVGRAATYPIQNFMNPVYYHPNTAAVRGPWIVNGNTASDTFTYAYALQDNISMFNDRLIVVLGARYDNQIQDNYNFLNNNNTSNAVREGWSRKGALLFMITDTLSTYYNYSETFQPGTFNAQTGAPWKNIETSNNEFGFKLGNKDGSLSATASYYETKRANGILTFSVIDPNTGLQGSRQEAVGLSVAKGWEMDFAASFKNGVALIGGIGDSESKNDLGRRVRGTPFGINYRIFTRYTIPEVAKVKGLWVGAGLTRTGNRGLDAADSYDLPGYSMINLVAGWSNRRLSFQVNVDNLTDVQKPHSASTRGDINMTVPRTVSISGRWKF
jgi:iron complex outermembrane receptor protein